jgi:TonB family protein
MRAMIFMCVLAAESIAVGQSRPLRPCQIENVSQSSNQPEDVRKQKPPRRIRVSQGVADRRLLCATLIPLYPAEAKAKHLEGEVVLKALIGTDGLIKKLTPVSGIPIFIEPAMRAVKEWHYRPYTVKGKPAEIETEITVNFKLEGATAPPKQNSQPASPTGN